LIGIGGRHDLSIPAGQGNSEATRREPGASSDILCVAELRCGDRLALEVCSGAQAGIGPDYQRSAAFDRAGDDADILTARFGIGVDRWAGTNIGQVDRVGEDRLHSTRAGIVNEPLDLHAWAEVVPEPPLSPTRKIMRHERLNMRNVRKVADAKSCGLCENRAATG